MLWILNIEVRLRYLRLFKDFVHDMSQEKADKENQSSDLFIMNLAILSSYFFFQFSDTQKNSHSRRVLNRENMLYTNKLFVETSAKKKKEKGRN